MILSNTELLKALDQGWIKIDPQPAPKGPSPTEECPYQTTAVDLRLSPEILVPNENVPIDIDLRGGKFRELATRCYDTLVLTNLQPLALAPRKFVLGRTLERVTLPLPTTDDTPCYAARIEGRSSYARCGLTVHLTAPTIHAGFDGMITLEICNFGPYTIQLYPKMPVCQLIIEAVHGMPFRNDSQFHGQVHADGRR